MKAVWCSIKYIPELIVVGWLDVNPSRVSSNSLSSSSLKPYMSLWISEWLEISSQSPDDRFIYSVVGANFEVVGFPELGFREIVAHGKPVWSVLNFRDLLVPTFDPKGGHLSCDFTPVWPVVIRFEYSGYGGSLDEEDLSLVCILLPSEHSFLSGSSMPDLDDL